MHLLNQSETSISKHNHRPLQHQCALKEKFEEGKLTSLPSEITEKKTLDARPDAFYCTRLVPELHVELAGGLMRFTGLKIG
jgi:hypothetical protein